MEVIKTTLLERARRIVNKFYLKDEDIRRCATEFIKELSELIAEGVCLGTEAESHVAGLGLQQKTPSMCQIPTYVTQIASGSEKVGVCQLDETLPFTHHMP